MTRIAFLIALPLLASCSGRSDNSNDNGDNLSIRADENGNIAFNLPIAHGEVKIPTAYMSGGNFDIDGVKLMPGSEVTSFNLDSHSGASLVSIGFTAPASPASVRSYFLDQFSKQGVEAAVSGDRVTGKSKDGSPFTIEVSPGSRGSEGKILVQAKD